MMLCCHGRSAACLTNFSFIKSVSRRRRLALSTFRCLGSAFEESDKPIPAPYDGDDRVYSSKVSGIVDQIAQLSLLEVADLNRLIKKRFDLPDAAPMMYGAPMPSSAAPKAEEEEEAEASKKTSFAVKLLKFDDGKKIQLIKEIKVLVPGLNLVQAKNFVESLPQMVRSDIGKDEAEELVKKLESVGGKAEVE